MSDKLKQICSMIHASLLRYKPLLPNIEITLVTAMVLPCLAFLYLNPFVLSISSQFHGAESEEDVNSENSEGNWTCIADDPSDADSWNMTTVFTRFLPNASNDQLRLKAQEIRIVAFSFCILGYISAGITSDLLGRRCANIIMLMIAGLSGLLATVSFSMTTFQICWSLIGLGACGARVVTFVRISELLSDSHRLLSLLIIFGLIWALSKVTALIFVFVFQDWQLVAFFLSFCSCLVVMAGNLKSRLMSDYGISKSLKESSSEEAINAGNSDEGSHSSLTVLTNHQDDHTYESPSLAATQVCNKADSIRDLFTNFVLIKRLLTLSFSFFTSGLIYYGLNLSKDFYFFRMFMSNLVFRALFDCLTEIISALICFKTKRTLAVFLFFMLCSGVVCFVNIGVGRGCSHATGLQVLPHYMRLFTVTASFNILWFITIASFPTKMRTTALGLCVSAIRLGYIAGVAIEKHQEYESVMVLAMQGVFSILSGLSVVFLMPERANKPLLRYLKQEKEEKEADKGICNANVEEGFQVLEESIDPRQETADIILQETVDTNQETSSMYEDAMEDHSL